MHEGVAAGACESPRPDLLGDVRHERRKEPHEGLQAPVQRCMRRLAALGVGFAVRAPLHELHVVVAEVPELLFCDLERQGVVVVVELVVVELVVVLEVVVELVVVELVVVGPGVVVVVVGCGTIPMYFTSPVTGSIFKYVPT